MRTWVLLSQCALVLSDILKSETDLGEYHYRILNNGMKVLIVKNESFTKASCALTVDLGFKDDPKDFAGLTHLLEHLLFTGSERYPEKYALNEYLNQHSGSQNAQTTDEYTTFHFDVVSTSLLGAADIFSQFFVSPLFKTNAIDGEISAVNSEFLNMKNDENLRPLILHNAMMREDRVERNFGCGRTGTLKKAGTADAILKHWKENYSSDRMTLVICGNNSLRELNKVADIFEAVPRRAGSGSRSARTDSTEVRNLNSELFEEKFLSRVVQFKPHNDIKEMMVLVTVPPGDKDFEVNAIDYIAHRLKESSEGGLVSRLRDENLAFGLSFKFHTTHHYTEIWVAVDLTEHGFREYMRVLAILYAYISALKADEREYSRMKQLSEIEFRYAEADTAVNLAKRVSIDMRLYPIKYVLKYKYIFDRFDKKRIEDTIAAVASVQDWVVLLSNPEGTFDMKEEHYGIEYGIHGDQLGYSGSIDIPQRQSRKKEVLLGDVRVIRASKRYLKTKQREHGNVMLVFDSKFGVPKVLIEVNFLSEAATRSNAMYTMYFTVLVETFRARYGRELDNLLVSVSVKAAIQGVTIVFDGFSKHMVATVKHFFSTIDEYTSVEDGMSVIAIPDGRFELIRQQVQNMHLGELSKSPFMRLTSVFQSKVTATEMHEEKLALAKRVKRDEVRIEKRFFCEILAVGNIEFAGLEDLLGFVVEKYVTQPIPRPPAPKQHGPKRIDFKTGDEMNVGIGMFYKVNDPREGVKFVDHDEESEVDEVPTDARARHNAIGLLLSQMARTRFFKDIRVKQGLGYVVESYFVTFVSSEYVAFIVQSKKSVEFLEKRILKFIADLKVWISGMANEEFTKFKEAVAGLQVDTTLKSFRNRIIGQYKDGEIDLNDRLKLRKIVERLTREDVLRSGILDEYVRVASSRSI